MTGLFAAVALAALVLLALFKTAVVVPQQAHHGPRTAA